MNKMLSIWIILWLTKKILFSDYHFIPNIVVNLTPLKLYIELLNESSRFRCPYEIQFRNCHGQLDIKLIWIVPEPLSIHESYTFCRKGRVIPLHSLGYQLGRIFKKRSTNWWKNRIYEVSQMENIFREDSRLLLWIIPDEFGAVSNFITSNLLRS